MHSYWSDAWIGGNVYTSGGTPIATGYVLRQYTAFSRTICRGPAAPCSAVDVDVVDDQVQALTGAGCPGGCHAP